jgi:DNA-binding NarL/FixJ family response regulator
MRVLIVDDHQLFIDGLKHIVELLDEDTEVLEANSADQAAQYLDNETQLDLVLLDLHMPGLDGKSVIRHQREQESFLPIVIISGDDNPNTIQSVIDEGAIGFIPKHYSGKQLLKALQVVLNGDIFIPDMSNNPIGHGITRRQLAVLNLMADGYSNKQISSLLNLTENTIKSHVSALFREFDASNRTECVKIARENRIIS